MEQTSAKPSKKQKTKNSQEYMIEFNGKNYVYNYIKIVSRQVSRSEFNLSDIDLENSAILNAKRNFIDNDELRVFKDRASGKYRILSGKNKIREAIDKHETIVRGKLVLPQQLLRTLAPEAPISTEKIAEKLSHNDRFKLSPEQHKNHPKPTQPNKEATNTAHSQA
jgi:hypothetical protein